MKDFRFTADVSGLISDDGLIVAVPPGLHTKNDLIESYAASFQFPEYWDTNWDAFADFLGDLHWISENIIVIAHSDIPLKENKRDRTIYLEILEETVALWRKHDAHSVTVAFPPTCEKELARVLTDG